MSENIDQMTERHKNEISQLQRSCKHIKTKRMPYMWAPGHFGGDVEVCNDCGLIIKYYDAREIR